MPTPLHNHTHYSALDGLATPSQIADRCAATGYASVAVTDHDVVAGHVDFYNTIKGAGLKPILGIETYQTPGSRRQNKGFRSDPVSKAKADNFHLILLAKNNTGLKNLYNLVSEAHATGFYYNARTDWDLLEKYSEGIIATSACALGMMQQALKGNSFVGEPEDVLMKYLNIFGENFYLELSTYPMDFQYTLNLETVSLSRQFGVPVVYANDAHYASPTQYPLHEATLCMQYVQKIADQTEPHHEPSLYIMEPSEVETHLEYLGNSMVTEALANSDIIADMCNANLPERSKRLPVFIPESNYTTAKAMLFDKVIAGYEEKVEHLDTNGEYMARIEKELRVIYDADLIDYFMMVRDYIEAAREMGYLVGPGRGSVGGSLVAYLLGVTEIDPIRFGLIFERFYNAGRETSLPDVDTDFPTYGRDDVKQYIINKYGPEQVGDIGNVLTMQGKAAIQKVGLALGVPRRDLNAINKLIDTAIESGLQPSWEMIYDKCGDELKTYKLTYPTLFEYAEALYGHVFSYGVHASGTIISDSPLRDECPLRWVAKDKKLVTQFDYRTVESLGYMKVDLLGLRNLDTLMEVNNILESDGKDKIDFPSLINQTFPDEMWEIAEKGWTVGLFQIESGGTAKRLAKEIKPRSIEDLAIITAVNRPGPLIAKADKAYVSGRNGQPVHYINDIVKECTRESFGQFIYQEQVINFFTKIGYDLMEADDVRSIMGKKKREAMKAELPRYMERSQQYMDKDTAEAVWLNIENFSKYAFNKAHSIGYGIILLWTMYAKWKHPQEFILAGLRTADKTDGHRYVDEAQRMGIAVLPPELNSSDTFAKIDGDAIRYGYSDVKGIGPAVGRWLVKNGPWKDWDEVLEKAQLDEYKATLPNGMRRMAINRGQIDTLRSFEENDGDEAKKIQLEENLLGVALSDPAARILEDHATDISTDCTAYEDLKGPGSFTVAGVIKEVKKTKTRQGAEMAWVKIEQGGSELDIAVWGTELKRLNFIWSKRKAVVIQVKVTEDNFVSLVAAKVLYSKEVKQNGRV